MVLGAALLLLLIGAEIICRVWLGLGDPPLSIADPQIEFLFKPSSTYHRFGNLVHYNAYSMRSDDFPAHKTRADEFRVMVVGDSVVNGGSMTDQSRLATAILQKQLAVDLGRPVVVGNISAGNWGPLNELAFIQRFGLFDADAVVLVLSSHDGVQVPTFEPIVGVREDYPDHTPLLALTEAVTRYVPLYLPWRSEPPPHPLSPEALKGAETRCLQAIRDMIAIARAHRATVFLALHMSPEELSGKPECRLAAIAAAARQAGIEPIELGPVFAATIKGGRNPYRDIIHPNELGQELIARELLPRIKETLNNPTSLAH